MEGGGDHRGQPPGAPGGAGGRETTTSAVNNDSRWSRVDGSCGPMDEGDLWGPAALARAKAASRDTDHPVEGEVGLMRQMRKKVGPFASEALILTHLRGARGKLHWSVNGYFRQAVLERGANSADFEPRPIVARVDVVAAAGAREASILAAQKAEEHSELEIQDNEEEEKKEEEIEEEEEEKVTGAAEPPTPLLPPALPPLVWEMLLSRIPPTDACRLASVARVVRDASRSSHVWRLQYEARWGATAAARVASRVKPLTPPPPTFYGGAQRVGGGEGSTNFDGSGGGGGG
eukprot:CAMPEP_0197587618 /NCGR_PEP_ID=MMETSP1326-20131121/9186_1 /TAXON_ID=1155430 /ORGANISM="Genus nov. species nov., Strain RCC2288" /LENGTH=289 /DNA_ID=CAMNT_0043152371 /DNA_START=73 /DNA_END=938 /DNA_ORIENTATION=+